MNQHIVNHEKALDFILGGNALFTIKNPKTNNRFTYKVKKHKIQDLFFVQVLTGPDIFEYFGLIKNSNFRHSQKSRISDEAQSVKVFDFLITKLQNNNLLDFIEIWHEGKCCKCGRTLTDPTSIELGIGPQCRK